MFVFVFAFIFVLKLPQPRKDLQTSINLMNTRTPSLDLSSTLTLLAGQGPFSKSWLSLHPRQICTLGRCTWVSGWGVFSGSCSFTSEGSLMIWAQDIFLLFSHEQKGFIFCSLFQISCVVFTCVLMCPDMCSPLSGLWLFFFFLSCRGERIEGSKQL